MSIGERHLFSWLHLSDIHFGHGDKSYGWDQRRVLEFLTQDVDRARTTWPELPAPQAILVTGDVAFSGALASATEYEDAAKFLLDLAAQLTIAPEKIYVVPGNHDVQRDHAKALVDRARASPTDLDVLLADAQARGDLLARMANYEAFAKPFGARDLLAWKETVSVNDFGELSLVGLNTALLCNDDADKGQLALSGEQRQVLATAPGRIRLLLTHHPFEEDWLRDEASLKAMAERYPTVHLCGHLHDPRVDLIVQAGGANHVRVVAAAAHRDPKEAKAQKDSHGYNFGSLMVNANGDVRLRTWPRRWFPAWSSFRVDHLGVPDRHFHDDKSLGDHAEGSGLELHPLHSPGVHFWGDPEVRWKELLCGKRTLDVFGIALRTLFEVPRSEFVEELILKPGGTVRVVLADPRVKHTMARYDEDFGEALGERTRKVKGVLSLLKELCSKYPTSLQVFLTRSSFKYSAYRIDGDVLFVPYAMTPGRAPRKTPALAFHKRSAFVQTFLAHDLDQIIAAADRLTPGQFDAILSA